jgi:hypothetical protein
VPVDLAGYPNTVAAERADDLGVGVEVGDQRSRRPHVLPVGPRLGDCISVCGARGMRGLSVTNIGRRPVDDAAPHDRPASRALWMIRMESSWSGLPMVPNIIVPSEGRGSRGLPFLRPSSLSMERSSRDEPQNRMWRTDWENSKERTIYARVGLEAAADDPIIGVMETQELAELVVREHNDVLHPDHDWFDIYDPRVPDKRTQMCSMCEAVRRS